MTSDFKPTRPSTTNISRVVEMNPPRILCLSSRARVLNATRFRGLHVSPRARLAQGTKRQAPDASRQPEEDTLLDQNPHLKHATSSQGGKEGRDQGKGNAAPDPELPSRKLDPSAGTTPRSAKGDWVSNEKRKMHTSAVLSTQGKVAEKKHTAESYFKDVDENPPASEKTFRVDGTSEATHRPNQQWADPNKEYATVSKDEPYEPPVEANNGEKPEQKNEKLGYGGTKRDAMRNAPAGDEGPQAKDAGGVKPNGAVNA